MKYKMEVDYETVKGLETTFFSEQMTPEKIILLAEDFEKTGRVKNLTIMDLYDTSWTLKELKKHTAEVKANPHACTVYFDGGYDKKKKVAGLGCVVYYKQGDALYRIRRNALIKELTSNNEAEYAALHYGLRIVEELDLTHQEITCIGDSMVVTHQLSGDWACYEEELISWMDRIEKLIDQRDLQAKYEHIPRTKNKEADQLATQALQGIERSSEKRIK